MKNAFLTIDVEEWYQLEYLDSHENDRKKVKMIPAILNLLDLLDQYQIKATFFVLADITEEYFDVLNEIKDRGHEIGCHGMDHRLLHDISDEEFKINARAAKDKLESIFGARAIKGYRASCFSLNRSKLDILQELGYQYDSSYIRFSEHPLYGEIDITGYSKEQSLVYSKDGFYEFEIPTLKILGHNIPISGGGYMRLFPLPLIKALISKFWRLDSNIIFYIHPFELTSEEIPFTTNTSFMKKFRASVGRKKNLNKLESLIKWLLMADVSFLVPSQITKQGSIS